MLKFKIGLTRPKDNLTSFMYNELFLYLSAVDSLTDETDERDSEKERALDWNSEIFYNDLIANIELVKAKSGSGLVLNSDTMQVYGSAVVHSVLNRLWGLEFLDIAITSNSTRIIRLSAEMSNSEIPY